MEQVGQAVNLTISLVYVIAAGVAVFLGLKIGLAEVKKDIQYILDTQRRLEAELTKLRDRHHDDERITTKR
jgi:hypothetical protein